MKVGPEDVQRISRKWDSMWKGVMEAQSMALNWIFTLNVGGLAGSLTYAASKQASGLIVASCVAFICGIILLVVFAVLYYYFEARGHARYRDAVTKLYAGHMSFDEFKKREQAEVVYVYRSCELLAWGAGVAGVAGLIMTIFAVI